MGHTPAYLTKRNETTYVVTHYIKKYPDRLKLILYKTPYRASDYGTPKKVTSGIWLQTEDEKLDNKDKSLGRAKTVIADLIISNRFDLFVTFTFNCIGCRPKCINKPCTCSKETCTRYDLDYVIRTQKTWYNNQIKRYGKFPYLQVMELHKDNGYHFHALFREYKGVLKPWKKDRKDGREVYNLKSYRKGFTTAKKIYDISGASSYVRKYITKDIPRYQNKKRYWASKGLQRPIVTQNETLLNFIMNHPEKSEYIPRLKPYFRENGTLAIPTQNIQSITTLMMDNDKEYFTEYKLLQEYQAIFGNLHKSTRPFAIERIY